MTSENTQLQALIQQIDEVLDKTNPRLPWVTSSDAIQQRQVLEQTRSYLRSLQQEAAATPPRDEAGSDGKEDSRELNQELDRDASDVNVVTAELEEYALESEGEDEPKESSSVPVQPVSIVKAVADRADDQTNDEAVEITNRSNQPIDNPTEVQAQQVLQAVLQEMSYLRANLLQPMRSDVEALRLQREVLTQEIQQLEQQRQQYGGSFQNSQYLHEFLQAAMAQMQEKMQENLTGQMAQVLATLSSQAPNPQQLQGSAAMLSPVERLEQLQRIQAQSDQLMSRLDTTLRLVFESLQNHMHSYGDSLEEGLSRMHNMGQQGEAVFGAFVTRLAQLLGREASAFLQAPVSETEWSNDRPSLPEPDTMATPESLGTKSDAETYAQLNQLLTGLQALDPSIFDPAPVGEPIPFVGESVSEPSEPPSDQWLQSFDRLPDQSMAPEHDPDNTDLEPDLEIDALDRTLSQIDLSAISSVETFEMQENSLLHREQSSLLPSLVDETEPNLDSASDRQTSDRKASDEAANEAWTSNDLESDRTSDWASDAALDLLSQVALEPNSFQINESLDEKGLDKEAQDIVTPFDVSTDADIFAELNLLSAQDRLFNRRFDADRDKHPSTSSESIGNSQLINSGSAVDMPQPGENWLLHARPASPEPENSSHQTEYETNAEEESEDNSEELEPEPAINQETIENDIVEQAIGEQEQEQEQHEQLSSQTCDEFKDDIQLATEIASKTETETQPSIETIALLTDLIPFVKEDRLEAYSLNTDIEQFTADMLLESTIEDLFAAIDAEPIDHSSEILTVHPFSSQNNSLSLSSLHSQLNDSEATEIGDPLINAFTLDGLDSLFEGLPSMDVDDDSEAYLVSQDNEELHSAEQQPEEASEAIDRAERNTSDSTRQLEPKIGTIADLTRDLLQEGGES